MSSAKTVANEVTAINFATFFSDLGDFGRLRRFQAILGDFGRFWATLAISGDFGRLWRFSTLIDVFNFNTYIYTYCSCCTIYVINAL
jgi:uncharacterized protein YutD